MRVTAYLLAAALSMGALAVSNSAHAKTINVELGASSEDFTLYGMGETYPGSGIGTFTSGQGTGVYDGVDSTFTLSGNITGGSPGYSSGTYAFLTTYAGNDAPTGGPNALQEQSNPANVNQFYYIGIDPSTSITLDLTTPMGFYSEELVQNGNFVAGTSFSFTDVTATCTGVAVCSQNNVGVTPGATISGPVTTAASFTVPDVSAAPEPSTWLLMFAGIGGIGLMLRRAKQTMGFRLKDALRD